MQQIALGPLVVVALATLAPTRQRYENPLPKLELSGGYRPTGQFPYQQFVPVSRVGLWVKAWRTILLRENTRRARLLACVLLVLALAPLSKAQTQSNGQYPKIEIFGGYSSIETNNHNFHFGPSTAEFTATNTDFDEGGRGFEVAITRNLNRYVGIMGDFSAHFSRDQGFVAVTSNGHGSFQISPCPQPPCSPVTQSAVLNPRLFNFLAGPELKGRNHTRFTPFAHALFGMTHTTNTFSTSGSALNLSRTDADTGFGMTYGGGVEIRLVRKVSIRVSLDYSKAYVGSSALPSQRVNSVGFSIGVVIH